MNGNSENQRRGQNLLPVDGRVEYFGPVFSIEEADRHLAMLLRETPWKSDVVKLFGKRIITARKVAWYGDEPFEYTYSKTTKKALIRTPELRELKSVAEHHSGESYNSCLLNLYHTGDEGMAWHSDDEKDLKPEGAIASLSFGAERRFSFKHKRSGEKVDVFLEHGSLLVMKGSTQSNWLHRLPPTKKVKSPRINLTFRTVVRQN